MTKKPVRPATKPAAPAVESEIVQIDETHRKKLMPFDVVIYEELVQRARIDRQRNTTKTVEFWQATHKETPVLLVTTPRAFTPRHEEVLRREPNVEEKQDRVIRGALRKHTENGEIFFEMGKSDEEMDEVIEYAAQLLKAYGVTAKRAIRTTTILSRGQW